MTDETRLLRQVHPNFVQNGVASDVLAFRPKESDDGRLSVYDGDLISAQGSHAHYTERLKLQSSGVLAVTKAECADQGLAAASSPLPDFAEHAHIDFSPCVGDKKRIRDKSKTLLALANKRGWLYRPES